MRAELTTPAYGRFLKLRKRGPMDKRIVELALEALKVRKVAIETEIAEVEAELRGLHRGTPGKASRAGKAKRAGATRKSGPQSAAARKAVSARMKLYWAKRKAEEARAAKKAKS